MYKGRRRIPFFDNVLLQDAVLYRLSVIGEAAQRLGPETRARLNEIPWKKIIRMRNIVMHDYFGVDLRITWDTVRTHVPELIQAVRKVLPLE